MRFPRWIDKILNAGVFPDLSYSERRRIRLLNSIILIGLGVVVFFGVLDVLYGYYETMPILVLMAALAVINHKLVASRRYLTAKLVTFWSMLILASAFCVIAGDAAGSQYILIPFVIVPVVLFQSTRTTVFLVGIIYIDFIVIRELQARIDPIIVLKPDAVEFYLRAAAFNTLMIAYGLTAFLKKENERFEHIITEQRDRIESHLKEVTDSINYARRLQNALLPPREKWTRHLPDSFLLYIPKDIVAGDFYWMETSALSSPKDAARDSVVLFAAADCTGHGVPGAMVSVICSNALNKAVLEEGNTDPARILDRTRELVIEQFGKAEEEVKDGMDISLCALNGNTLHWAGANNPLWLVRNGELQEFKPNKQPIGRFSDVKPFTTHTIPLQKGDTLFVFTDGFQDQFGGEKGKKFKASHFKELLLSVNNESMERQCALIKDAFEHWRGDLEQIDDVCVIGVRL